MARKTKKVWFSPWLGFWRLNHSMLITQVWTERRWPLACLWCPRHSSSVVPPCTGCLGPSQKLTSVSQRSAPQRVTEVWWVSLSPRLPTLAVSLLVAERFYDTKNSSWKSQLWSTDRCGAAVVKSGDEGLLEPHPSGTPWSGSADGSRAKPSLATISFVTRCELIPN